MRDFEVVGAGGLAPRDAGGGDGVLREGRGIDEALDGQCDTGGHVGEGPGGRQDREELRDGATDTPTDRIVVALNVKKGEGLADGWRMGRLALEEEGGGRGSGTQKVVYQKRPDQIFPLSLVLGGGVT